MSAIPQSFSLPAQPHSPCAEQPPPRGVEWLDLQTAADRAGVLADGLRHRIKDWQPKGLVKFEQPPEGGKARWYVRADADPRFTRGGVLSIEDASRQFDLRPFTDEQRATILFREKVVKEWIAQRTATARGDWQHAKQSLLDELLAKGNDVSERTVHNWVSAYEGSGRAGLVDSRWTISTGGGGGGGGGGSLMDGNLNPFAPFYAELKRWYQDGNQPGVANCYKLACAMARREGWPIPSDRSARAFIAKLPKPEKIRGRKGQKAFDDKCASFIKRDYTRIEIDGVERAMESDDIWCSDHHICDVLVRDGVDKDGEPKFIRPWLTPWMDMRSRKIVGYRFSRMTPDSSTVLLALRDAVKRNDFCTPRISYTDNGKDFDCYQLTGISKAARRGANQERKRVRIEHDQTRFTGVYASLQIGVSHAIPYNAKAKPIERFFRTFEDQFGRMQWTYCGNKPENKPGHLPERLAKNEAPTYEDFVADAGTWIEQLYNEQPHTGHGMEGLKPNQVHVFNRGERRIVAENDLDVCMQLMPKPQKVGRNGVTWGKWSYGKDHPSLRPYFGQLVQLFVDPDDISKVQIRDTAGRWICEVPSNELGMWGQTSNDKGRDVRRRMNAHNTQLANVEKRGLRRIANPMELILEDHLAKQQAAPTSPTSPPPKLSYKSVQTSFEQPPPEPLQLRPAVGSENVAFPATGSVTAKPRTSALDKLMQNGRDAVRPAVTPRRDPWDKATQLRGDQ